MAALLLLLGAQQFKLPAPNRNMAKKPFHPISAPEPRVLACPACGARTLEQVSSRAYRCLACGAMGVPMTFVSEADWALFKDRRDLERMRERKLWGQLVFGRTVPVVVLVNWFTALFFFIFFALGMAGWFRHEWFQWYFLYLSIAVVAVGFGVIVRWGKERVSF